MFLDKAKIKISSGSGGNGMVAWRREKYVDKGGPAGGDGGNGGDVYLIATDDMNTLMDFTYKSIYKAEDGENGRGKNQHGKCGKDLYIKVPCGTLVRDTSTGKIIAELTEEDEVVLVAKGGQGGRGNARFATSRKKAPQFCEPGSPEVTRELELELKLIADIGLLGMPNAGKSTLISVISSAKPKIADYPFTTLHPNLGMVRKPNGDGFVVADIPGLIENASSGTGLGHDFLRHVERCRFLIHVIDLTDENPLENFHKINNELRKYDTKVAELHQVIVLNKIDVLEKEIQEKYLKEFKALSDEVFLISAATKMNIDNLLNHLFVLVDKIPKPEKITDIEEDTGAFNNDDSAFEVIKLGKDTYQIIGGKVERLAGVTNLRNSEQVYRLQRILESMGVMKELEAKGIQKADTIKIGHLELEYYP